MEDKPILVSIGYSTCHWCHVMERESFEDRAIAALMNEHFVNIKVDREERPDVDKIYMTAVSAMTGQGGWPLNMFLTPDLKPFYGGTYYPPEARWGHPAWRDVLEQIAAAWKDPSQRQRILEAGNHLSGTLTRLATLSHQAEEFNPETFRRAYDELLSIFDGDRGGFGPAPKFPMPVYHNFLLRYSQRFGEPKALAASLDTLVAMANGGIFDHVGGGFSRYSTDPAWRLPHFEKMLYDNAQLALNYVEAFQISQQHELERVARSVLAYVRCNLAHPQGGFYSAEDADSLPDSQSSNKREGAFYAWEESEVRAILRKSDSDLFCFHFGIRSEGNVAQDPLGEFRNQNVLYVAHAFPETAHQFGLSVAEVEKRIGRAVKMLFEIRSRRPRPHLDDKVITAWNGLMISAFARASQVFGDRSYLESAQRAADFLKQSLYEPVTKVLFRRWRDGERAIRGTSDDYAFLALGLLDLYESDFNWLWLDWAQELADRLLTHFSDPDSGALFMTEANADPHLLARVKEDMDNVEPSASSIAALVFTRLGQLIGDATYESAARRLLKAYSGLLREHPRAMPQMLVAADWLTQEARSVIIVGQPENADTQALVRVVHSQFIEPRTVHVFHPRELGLYVKRMPFIANMKMVQGRATAYVCVKHVCQTPTSDPAELAKQLWFRS